MFVKKRVYTYSNYHLSNVCSYQIKLFAFYSIVSVTDINFMGNYFKNENDAIIGLRKLVSISHLNNEEYSANLVINIDRDEALDVLCVLSSTLCLSQVSVTLLIKDTHRIRT